MDGGYQEVLRQSNEYHRQRAGCETAPEFGSEHNRGAQFQQSFPSLLHDFTERSQNLPNQDARRPFTDMERGV